MRPSARGKGKGLKNWVSKRFKEMDKKFSDMVDNTAVEQSFKGMDDF